MAPLHFPTAWPPPGSPVSVPRDHTILASARVGIVRVGRSQRSKEGQKVYDKYLSYVILFLKLEFSLGEMGILGCLGHWDSMGPIGIEDFLSSSIAKTTRGRSGEGPGSPAAVPGFAYRSPGRIPTYSASRR